jgi:c-di-GMP-binding flagellar brake protein YcgR
MKVELPRLYDVKARLSEDAEPFAAHILDVDPETVLLRVPAGWEDEQIPERVILSYGYKNFQWEVPADVRAAFDHWWFLSRPDEVDCRRFQRRAFVRIGYETSMMAIPTDATGKQTGSARPFRTVNLSANGCLAQADEALGAAGDHLMVFLSLPGLQTVPALSRVVRAAHEGNDGLYGIHFKGLGGLPQEQVVHFVTSQIREKLSRGQDIIQPER